ncbi:MAG TPA: prenyltransferase [Verrucomicrobiae bacterium]|nr:prenyltransferase [Verrucomicrobiae bacterium]
MSVNVKMWGKALRQIPRVDKKEWDTLDSISQWLIATRGALFLVTAYSCIIGALMAWRIDYFNVWKLLLCACGLILAHGTNNLINDYTDSVRGVDSDNYFRTIYGPQPMQLGWWSKRQQLTEAAVTGLLAAACGVALIFITHDVRVAWLMAIGAIFVLFYTWPLKYLGLGEIAEVIIWGPLMAGGTYLVLTDTWSWPVAAVSVVYGLSVASILMGKHTDKLREDKKKGVHTLPVILGERVARYTNMSIIAIQPVLIVLYVILGWIGPVVLITLFSIPAIVRTLKFYSKPRPTERPETYPAGLWPLYLSHSAFKTSKTVGGLFVLGLLADTLITRL